MTPSDLADLCLARITDRLAEMDHAPRPEILMDISSVLEVLDVDDSSPLFARARALIAQSAVKWLRNGLLENASFAAGHYLYQCSLLAFVMARENVLREGDIDVLNSLLSNGLIGRSELPLLSLRLMMANFSAAGCSVPHLDLPLGDVRNDVDKRTLRTRTDEYDIAVLLMLGRLVREEKLGDAHRPTLLPQVMLVQAMRSENTNWIPVLALLCARNFPSSRHLQEAANSRMSDLLQHQEGLLPLPNEEALENEYVARAPDGLRIRSTLACCAMFGV